MLIIIINIRRDVVLSTFAALLSRCQRQTDENRQNNLLLRLLFKIVHVFRFFDIEAGCLDGPGAANELIKTVCPRQLKGYCKRLVYQYFQVNFDLES